VSEYVAKSINRLSFSLIKSENTIGELCYKRWFSFKAQIELPGHKTFAIVPNGFWRRTFQVKNNEHIVFEFRRKWNGDLLIQTYFGDKKELLFKRKETFKKAFVLVDQENNELLQLKPGLNWSKVTYEYEITTSALFEDFDNDILLILITVHCANFAIAAMTGIIAAS
jgi:uncharacterized protein YxjI